MSSNERSEARSVILRLRRYRDRIEDITSVDGSGVAARDSAGAAARRGLTSLKNDLDHDSHECEIGRKRKIQSDCEQTFLWPALRETAGAMRGQSGPRLLDAHTEEELRAARAHILNDLGQLERLDPTLERPYALPIPRLSCSLAGSVLDDARGSAVAKRPQSDFCSSPSPSGGLPLSGPFDLTPKVHLGHR